MINPQFSRQLTRALATGPQSVISLLNDVFKSMPGVRAVTWLATAPDLTLTHRIGTSNRKNFPIGGSDPIDGNVWNQRIFEDRHPVIADTPEQMAAFIPETDQLIAMGYGAILCTPIIIDDEVRGTVNILGNAGMLTTDFLDGIETYLPIAALIFTFPGISEFTKTTTGKTPEQTHSNQGDCHALL